MLFDLRRWRMRRWRNDRIPFDRDIIVVTSINGTFSFDALFLYENFKTDTGILQIFCQYEFLNRFH